MRAICALSTGTRIAACEHLFVTSQGSAYGRFQRALATGNLQVIEAAAAELPAVGLDDALAILAVLAQTGNPRFDRAAARWVGRLLTETPAALGDARFAVALVEASAGLSGRTARAGSSAMSFAQMQTRHDVGGEAPKGRPTVEIQRLIRLS